MFFEVMDSQPLVTFKQNQGNFGDVKDGMGTGTSVEKADNTVKR